MAHAPASPLLPGHAAPPALPGRRRGFTLVEMLVALALFALLVGLALPTLRGQDLRAARLDAVDALGRLQAAQERHRSAHGLYTADLAALAGTGAVSGQGRYAISLALVGPEGYDATANALGPQARDTGCTTLTLRVRQGFAETGPSAACWLR